MKADAFRIVKPDRYDIATEVLSSAVRILEAVGFARQEIPELFEQVANLRSRGPIWIEPPARKRRQSNTRRSSRTS